MTSPETPTPERSPVAAPGLAEDFAWATTSLAVTSPLKSERFVTSAEAFANGLPVESDWTLATYESAVTAGPSEPEYEKPLPGATASLGGEEIVGVDEPPPGTTTRIANARASAPAVSAPELVPTEPVASERAEALSRGLVRPERLVLVVARVGGDLLADRPHLLRERLAVRLVAEQCFHPGLAAVVGRDLVLEEELPQHEPDADVGERAEREQPARRRDEPLELGVLRLQPRHDAADRLVDERKPNVFGARHSPQSLGALGRLPPGSQHDLGGDGKQQHGEEAAQRHLGERLGDEHAADHAGDRRHAQDERGAPANVPVPVLAPCADRDRGQDRQERGGLGRALRQAEREQRRHEEEAAADAQQPGDDTRGQAERDRCEVDRAHGSASESRGPGRRRRRSSRQSRHGLKAASQATPLTRRAA